MMSGNREEGASSSPHADVREARAEDMGAVASIYNNYILRTTTSFETEPVDADIMRRRFDKFSAETGISPLVAEVDGEVVGYAYVHPWKERAAYCHTLETTIYLADGCKGRGIGGELMRRLIDDCRDSGRYHALIACITAENEESIRFHSRLGFREVSRFVEVGSKFGRWLDVVDMQLML